ncbi:SH3 domain-containing protein [Pelagibacterium lacus]|uniref:SH3 domain-containing protein n=1 Tax=Pelagibacterium lacus TaxID=2282655 RepID=UPI0011C0515E|nr:hypothetical protein [Pelagibacterium lacus]
MMLSSRLAFPAIIGGLVAIILSGVFTPPAMARGYPVELRAQVTGVAQDDHLNVRRWPAHYSRQVGQLPPHAAVWVERCIEVDNSSDWCLVAGGRAYGWVNSRFLAVLPH